MSGAPGNGAPWICNLDMSSVVSVVGSGTRSWPVGTRAKPANEFAAASGTIEGGAFAAPPVIFSTPAMIPSTRPELRANAAANWSMLAIALRNGSAFTESAISNGGKPAAGCGADASAAPPESATAGAPERPWKLILARVSLRTGVRASTLIVTMI